MNLKQIFFRIILAIGLAIVVSVILWWISLVHISAALFVAGVAMIGIASNNIEE